MLMFRKSLTRFATCESGAVTVEFVALTALVAGIGTAVVMVVAQGLHNGSYGIDSRINADLLKAEALGKLITGTP